VNTTTTLAAVADDQTTKYLTLLELSKAITSHRELPELFHDLACRLQNLFHFTHLGVVLHDRQRNLMRFHLLETCDPTQWQAPTEVPIEGSIAGWVWEHQEPMIIRDLELEDRFPIARTLLDHPVKSVCSLPMTTAHQQLGVMTFWSERVGAYDQLDLEFAKLVAAQIAVAVEAQCHQHKLIGERDRSQLLLEINNTLVSNLNLRELLSAISHCLNTVMPHDAAALALYDESLKQLRLTALDFPDHEEPCAAGEVISLEGTPAGVALTTRDPVVSDHTGSQDARLRSTGLKSGCTAPLLFRDRVLGILSIKSLRENAFSREDAELLGLVAKQVAIAVENALAYREIESLKKSWKERSSSRRGDSPEYNFDRSLGIPH
jgi:formate hydrogenlyase transcriptional activator